MRRDRLLLEVAGLRSERLWNSRSSASARVCWCAIALATFAGCGGPAGVSPRTKAPDYDPAAIRDVATYTQPLQYAVGVDFVAVNGQLVLDSGKMTAARPGRALRHKR
jgi:hypothetical protein